jgi:hypothetical protein
MATAYLPQKARSHLARSQQEESPKIIDVNSIGITSFKLDLYY